MPVTRPIPPEAMAVVELLRRDVERPQEMPQPEPVTRPIPQEMPRPEGEKAPLRWHGAGDGDDGDRWAGYCCPMGLHPKAQDPCPSAVEYDEGEWEDNELPVCPPEAVFAFGVWWDEQRDAEAAVEAVWPTRLGAE